MTRYIIRRVLIAIPVLFGLTIVTFALANLMPGDYVDALIPQEQRARLQIEEEDMERLREHYGLNQPIYTRYVIWLRELVLHGNLGRTMRSGEPVTAEIARRLPYTLQLTASSLFMGMVLGTLIGVAQALRQRSLFDNLANLLTFLWISVPSFVFAIVAIYLFAFKIPIFPTGGAGPVGESAGVLTRLRYMALPFAILTISTLPGYMRFARNSMLDVLHADYITVARAKGLPDRLVTIRHALRNALLPLITITALSVPGLIGGAAIAETIFVWPGMGLWTLESVTWRDYPVIVAMNLISSTLVLACNLLADIAYTWADPRVKYD